MQLFLVHNDPLDSLLVSADGEPLYSITTSVDPVSPPDDAFPVSRSPASSSSSWSDFSVVSGVTSASASSASSHPPTSPSSFVPEVKSLPRQFTSALSTTPPSPKPKHRQPPTTTHPAIPITRIHSNPHSHDHHQHPDPSSPYPSPVLPHAHAHRPPAPSSSASPTSPSVPITIIRRLERHQRSCGNTEIEVGRIDYCGDDVGTRVQLCHAGIEICAPAVPTRGSRANPIPHPSTSAPGSRTLSQRTDAGTALEAFRDFCLESQKRKEKSSPTSPSTTSVDEFNCDDDEEFIPDPTWSFKGPDNLSYKWISLASCPVLIHDTQPIPTPIARYRPAKLGIISRSRRGFLEILPGGLEKEDWIVVTFAGYFRMKLGGNIPLAPTPRIRHDVSSPLPTAPMGVMGVGVGVIRGPMSVSEPTTPIRAPRNLSPLKLPCSPSPLTYLEALRRKGKDYDLARRNC